VSVNVALPIVTKQVHMCGSLLFLQMQKLVFAYLSNGQRTGLDIAQGWLTHNLSMGSFNAPRPPHPMTSSTTVFY
jgi:hypothetical protein